MAVGPHLGYEHRPAADRAQTNLQTFLVEKWLGHVAKCTGVATYYMPWHCIWTNLELLCCQTGGFQAEDQRCTEAIGPATDVTGEQFHRLTACGEAGKVRAAKHSKSGDR